MNRKLNRKPHHDRPLHTDFRGADENVGDSCCLLAIPLQSFDRDNVVVPALVLEVEAEGGEGGHRPRDGGDSLVTLAVGIEWGGFRLDELQFVVALLGVERAEPLDEPRLVAITCRLQRDARECNRRTVSAEREIGCGEWSSKRFFEVKLNPLQRSCSTTGDIGDNSPSNEAERCG